MKRNHSFRILRDVFHILSYANKDDLLQASNQGHIAPNIAKALEALARESSQPKPKQRLAKRSRNKARIAGESGFNRMLLNSEVLKDKAAILTFAKQISMKFSAQPKDSHARILKRFLAAVKLLPEDARLNVIKALQGEKPSETEGWIDVINQRKP